LLRAPAEQGALAGEAQSAQRGGSGKRGSVQITHAHVAQHRQVLDVGEVAVDLHHILEAGTHRRQRGLEVLEHLHRLRAEISAQELAIESAAQLTRDEHGAAGSGDLHDLRVGRWLVQRLRIDEADVGHGGTSLGCRLSAASLTAGHAG